MIRLAQEHQFGWAAHAERPEELEERGLDTEKMILRMRETYPTYNAFVTPWTVLQFQGQQGACQGHALAGCAQEQGAMFTGVQELFSRAQGYYEAQRYDNINGDKGSTLAGGQKVLMEQGLVREQDWPYPTRYNPSRPEGFEAMPRIKIKSSKPITDPDMALEFLRAGGSIQTGLMWNSSCDQPICTNYRSGGGGGHSTRLFGLTSKTALMQYSSVHWSHVVPFLDPLKDDAILMQHHNSWNGWMGNGRNLWTREFLAQVMSKDRWSVFIGYDSTDVMVDEAIYDLED